MRSWEVGALYSESQVHAQSDSLLLCLRDGETPRCRRQVLRRFTTLCENEPLGPVSSGKVLAFFLGESSYEVGR